MKLFLLNIFFLFVFTSCATGSFKYSKPTTVAHQKRNKVVNLNFNKTWNHFIEKLSSSIYSVDHINKESGFININFSSNNPRDFLDCGVFNIKYQNARVKQDITFNGADTSLRYNVYNNGNSHPLTRNTKLIGKINVYFKKISSNKTSIKVNVKYNLNVYGQTGHMNNAYQWVYFPYSYNVNFASGEEGLPDDKRDIRCVAKGNLEALILDMAP